MASQETPLFAHDCETCIFLGTFNGKDLYFHRSELETTVLARDSSEPGDYSSGLEFALLGINPTLVEALARAKARGLMG